MRGVYEATFRMTGVTEARTMMYITVPANKTVELLSAEVTNETNETNEQLRLTIQHISSLGTPSGTAVTPAKLEQGDQAAGSTVVGGVTASEPTYSSGIEFGAKGVASLGGWYYQPVPEERPVLAGGSSYGIRLLTGPASLNLCTVMRFREMG